MSKPSKKTEKSKAGPIQPNPKHVLKKAKQKLKQKGEKKKKKKDRIKEKMSDLSSEASSTKSSGVSTKSGLTAPSSAPSSGSARKRQCDLCKLSYSSDKELTEHLVSLMHHTKLENKDENTAHNCVLCKVECRNMSDYRQHIGLSSHLKKIAYLKGEKVEKKKQKQSRWNPTGNEGQFYQNRSSNNYSGSNNRYSSNSFPYENKNSAPWNDNRNQGGNLNSWTFNIPQPQGNFGGRSEQGMSLNGCGTIFGYQNNFQDQNWGERENHDFSIDFPGNNNGNDWIMSRQFYDHDSQRSPRGQRYEPWGSGMFRDREGYGPSQRESYHQYGRGGYNQNDNFHGHTWFEENQAGHWDESSLRMQEQFLAAMDENNEGRSQSRGYGQGSSMDVDTQRIRWGSGAKTTTKKTSSSEELRGAEVLETYVPTSIDRKRPIEDNGAEDVRGSAARKTSRSQDLPIGKTSVAARDRAEPVRHEKANPASKSSGTSSNEIASASDLLLQRAERLCKELREKRLASAQTHGSRTTTKQQETILSQKLDTISQLRQQKYFKGLIKDKQDLSSGDSGISTGHMSQTSKSHIHEPGPSEGSKVTQKTTQGKQRSLDEIRKSLEVTVGFIEDTDRYVSKKKQKIKDKTVSHGFPTASPTLTKQALAIPQRERRDSSSSTGSKKSIAKPQALTKDSLKKMINAPRSRDERLHLAKLLQTAPHKPAVGTGTSRPVQLEGLYDSQTVDLDAAAEAAASNDVISTIKLEDLGNEVREQILSLIGSSCPGLQELQLPVAVPQTKTQQDNTTVLSGSEGSISRGKKQDKTSLAKKKSNVDGENLKKKTKKKVANISSMQGTATKDSKLSSINSSTDTLNTDCERTSNTKTKFLSPNVKPKASSSEIVIIDLVDSENEFASSQTSVRNTPESIKNKPGVKDKTSSKKKKKKKKDVAKEGQGSQVSSSLESDDVPKQSETSAKQLTFACTSQLKKTSNSNLQTSGEIGTGFRKKTSHEFLSESTPHRRPIEFDLSTSRSSETSPVAGRKTSLKSTKSTGKQESSLNSQNVHEKFPLLMKNSNISTSSVSPLPSSLSLATTAPISSAKYPKSTSQSYLSSLSSSTASTSYAKAVAITSSTSLPTSVLSQSLASSSVSQAPVKETSANQTANLQLRPSIFLANRPPQPVASPAPLDVEPVHNIDDAGGDLIKEESSILFTKSESGNVFMKPNGNQKDEQAEAKKKNTIIMDDINGAVPVEDDGVSLTSSAFSDELPRQAMTELLQLSEREEQIKQEAMSMELRLTRLHRLLEQAVVQISKCTERRTQLQEEEKEISQKRLSLLRGAAKGKHSYASSTSSSQNPTVTISGTDTRSDEASIDSIALEKLAKAPLPSSPMPTITTTSTPAASGLSRADWLAKFAAFLPPDPTREQERQAASRNTRSTSAPDPQAGQSLQLASPSERHTSSIQMSHTGEPVEEESTCGIISQSSRGSTNINTSISTASGDNASMENAVFTAPTTKAAKAMYVGSFLTPGAPVSKARPSGTDENIVSALGADSICHTNEYRRSNSLDKVPGKIIPLAEHGVRPHHPASIGTGDDSDIGSVASSLASGASLGEQITQYCRNTPGASLDPPNTTGLRGVGFASRHQMPDLSVILSSDASLSDHHSGSNQRGADEEEEGHYAARGRSGRGEEEEEGMRMSVEHTTRPCSVVLQHSEIDRRGIYGSLNHEAVRSAEALHVMERNYQEELKTKSQEDQRETEDLVLLPSPDSPNKGGSTVSLSDCNGSGMGKRKKRLTRQERESSQLTRHRKRWLVSSTSSDEDEVEGKETRGSPGTKLPSVARDKKQATCSDDRDSSDVVKTELIPKQEGQGDIVVAECDSSTGLGIVDSESIRQRTQTLREMRESFERTFGRSPRLQAASARDGDSGQGINSTTTDSVSLTYRKALSSKEAGDDLSLTYGCSSAAEIQLAEEEVRDTGLRRYESSGRPVCEIQVVDNHLYVGFQGSCITVFDLEGPSEEPISEHPFADLWCFYVTEIKDSLTVIVGNGCFLTFCSASDIQIPSRDMGTPIRCILYSNLEIFLGLDTGEICVINTKTMEERSRFICSDHSLCNMATAQEGAMKLLCVAARDGSISIINSRQCLLLRILSGHVKAALSLQVDKSSVFSGSMDGTVLEQNLHTTTVEHVYKEHKGLVMAVHLHKNFLLTAGMDKLVRCFDVKTHELVQVNYGAGRGAVSKIIVVDDKLITGNMNGIVDVIDFNINAQNKCPLPSCNLNFGHRTHLQWHQLQEQHYVNSEQTPIVVS